MRPAAWVGKGSERAAPAAQSAAGSQTARLAARAAEKGMHPLGADGSKYDIAGRGGVGRRRHATRGVA